MENLLERLAVLESVVNELHGQRQALERKTHRWRGASLTLGALVLLALPLRLGVADPPKNPKFPKDFNVLWLRVEADEKIILDQGNRIAALQGMVSTHGNQIGQLQGAFNVQVGQVAALQRADSERVDRIGALQKADTDQVGRIGKLEFLTEHFSRNGDQIVITGANLQIRNRTGFTDKADGTGNLILGYNEARNDGTDKARAGSHNLVIGRFHNVTSVGGLVVGERNEISGDFASVTGGTGNIARGKHSSVSGGAENQATNEAASVSGGDGNTASGPSASVSGGGGNIATGREASVSGGGGCSADGDASSVAGGRDNHARHLRSSISGGARVETEHDEQWRACLSQKCP
jgi:hypothetical protein